MSGDGGRSLGYGAPRAKWMDRSQSPTVRLAETRNEEQKNSFENALDGFYRKCSVDLVREQIESNFVGERPYDVQSTGLIVWSDSQCRDSLTVKLEGDEPMIAAYGSNGGRCQIDVGRKIADRFCGIVSTLG